jgi:hypothetical protein
MVNPVPVKGNKIDDEPDPKLNKIPQPRRCGGVVIETTAQ